MMESSLTILRVRGIPIGVHWTWLFVVAIVVWSLGTVLFPATYPGLDGATYLVMAVAAALLFFGSVLAHELGHALWGLHEGQHIDGITLWLFGGVARLRGTPHSPGAEFRVTLAGPVVSAVMAAMFSAAALAGDRLGWTAAVHGVLEYLGRINLLVLGFNLVPALPLDGGRMLRAWLWHRQRSFVAATRSAARAGQAFGVLLAAVGLLGLFTGTGLSGVWFVFVGWFLIQAAQTEAVAAQQRLALAGLSVRDLMTPDPVTVPPDLTVAEFVDRAAGDRRFSTYPVVESGRLIGVVPLRVAATVPFQDRYRLRVRDVMTPADQVPRVQADQQVVDALAAFKDEATRAIVVQDERPVGILSGSDVARALQVQRLRPSHREPAGRGAGVLVWVVVALVMLVAGAALYSPPFVVIEPGNAVDIGGDVTVSGTTTSPLTGRYLLTSVRLRRSNGLGTLLAALRTDRDVVRVGQVLPRGVDPREYFTSQREAFEQSRRLAAAAAARAAGLPVKISGNGVRVVRVLPDSPAAGVLRPGDVIVAVDEQPIEDADELRELVGARPAGTRLRLELDRGRVELRSAPLPGVSGGVGIGVQVETRNLQVDLPFQVRFRERPDVGGPSAGLAYALAISDLLEERDYAAGRAIAATGTIQADGDVGEVGGVEQKAIAAEQAGARLFLVPREEIDQARGAGLTVQGVDRLEQALRLLSGPV
jgi:PDZ domain-containing secreted protein/Zn-dependent protease/predicted transcriptional regulator